jgi:hypothetical protein
VHIEQLGQPIAENFSVPLSRNGLYCLVCRIDPEAEFAGIVQVSMACKPNFLFLDDALKTGGVGVVVQRRRNLFSSSARSV